MSAYIARRIFLMLPTLLGILFAPTSTILVWAGPSQVLFFASIAAGAKAMAKSDLA